MPRPAPWRCRATGYIDRYMPSYDKTRHQVRIVGRSKTEDLVDCAIDNVAVGWDFRANTIGQAARTLLAPWGIGLQLPDGDAELPDAQKAMSVYPGYTRLFLARASRPLTCRAITPARALLCRSKHIC